MGALIPGVPAARQLVNAIVNSRALVRQRYDAGIATSLTTARQIGDVDGVALWASGGAVSAGTLSNGSIGVHAAASAAAVTLTGAGKLSWATRIEARDAVMYANEACSFQVLVEHDCTEDIGYTVTVRKANAADDFSAMTTIDTQAAVAVSPATETRLIFNNVDMGDCSSGIEIQVEANCGVVVAKSFYFTNCALTMGSVAPDFFGGEYVTDITNCARYLRSFRATTSIPLTGWVGSTASYFVLEHFGMRAAPTLITDDYFTVFNIFQVGGREAATLSLYDGLNNRSTIKATSAFGIIMNTGANILLESDGTQNAVAFFLLSAELF